MMKHFLSTCFHTAIALFLLVPMPSAAQHLRLIEGEMVTCQITANRTADIKPGTGKDPASRSRKIGGEGPVQPVTFTPLLNQAGSFDRVADIRPNETVAIELTYPEAKPGEQVVVSVEDGGGINKEQKVGVYHLDNALRISFSFTTGEAAGLYRLAARKELETRIVQLWVGPELMPVYRQPDQVHK